MIRTKYDNDLTGIPMDKATPFFLYKVGIGFARYTETSELFGSNYSSWKGLSSSHSWKKLAFRHVGSIFGRQPESTIKLIVNK